MEGEELKMDYREAREYIENIQNRLGSDYSLQEVAELNRRMGRPDRDVPIVHIAGTNGKGSVGAFLAHILAAAGYTVGRYVSPAVLSYRERIQRILPMPGAGSCLAGREAGRMPGENLWEEKYREIVSPAVEYISREDVARLCGRLKELSEEMREDGYSQPTAFELETVMAFGMFRDWGVDAALVECGMGGRLDATNIIEKPVMCIFTSISRDHTAVLGDSLQQIAGEKYGIIKEGTSVVSCGGQPCEEWLRSACEKKGASLYLAQKPQEMPGDASRGQTFCYRGRVYRMSQLGEYQQENAALALEAASRLAALGFDKITAEAMEEGIYASRWRGRFEVVSEEPFLLVDGAHNADGAQKLSDSLQAAFPGEKFHLVVGVFKDKEYDKILEVMLPLAEKVFTVTAPGGRGLSSACLKEAAERLCAVPVEDCGTVGKALRLAAVGQAKTVVFGSLSILRDVFAVKF